jgi:ribosomal protein L32
MRLLKRQGNAIEMQCGTCKANICVSCGEWAHEGVLCENAVGLTERQLVSAEEQKGAFQEWLQDKGILVKTCPSCGAVIEKDGGCSHMTCKFCKHQFCFVCLKTVYSTHCAMPTS